MTPAEIYCINFQNPEPKYYSRVPHILDHLTYDGIDKKTGKKEVKRLSVFAIQLYRILKSVAGDHGACWKNTKHLAEQANMSVGAVVKAKDELQQKFHQLDGNPLISIEERQKKTENNGTVYHIITIPDIWRWNSAFMATLKFHKNTKDSEISENDDGPLCDEARSYGEPAKSARSYGEPASQGARSPGEPNKNPYNKNPLLDEQQSTTPPAAPPTVVFSDKKNRLFPSEGVKNIYQFLVKSGCHESTAYKIAFLYSQDDFEKAVNYTNASHKKIPKKNRFAYLLTVLEKRYWESKR